MKNQNGIFSYGKYLVMDFLTDSFLISQFVDIYLLIYFINQVEIYVKILAFIISQKVHFY